MIRSPRSKRPTTRIMICGASIVTILATGATAFAQLAVPVERAKSKDGPAIFWKGLLDLPPHGVWNEEERASAATAACAHADRLDQQLDDITADIREAGSFMAQGVDNGSELQVKYGISRLGPQIINAREKARDAGYAQAYCDQLSGS